MGHSLTSTGRDVQHNLFRARVAGGWLVMLSEAGSGTKTYAAGLTFVPGTEWTSKVTKGRKKIAGSAVKTASPRGA